MRTILSPGCSIPSLIFHYQCVCSCVCIWCWLLCRCACESERVLCEEAKCSNDHNTFSSSVGMSIEWLTGVSQVLGSRPDVFSCELKLYIYLMMIVLKIAALHYLRCNEVSDVKFKGLVKCISCLYQHWFIDQDVLSLTFHLKQWFSVIFFSFSYVYNEFYQELLKENSNPRLKGNRKGIIVKGKEFYIPILNTFPTR